uniref:Iron-binding zinc finger CDGSH type domain-containing protein n=1 Tax=Gadus morhua TaxID=8049 RepID=A0A8C5CSP6_GADMO
SPSATARTRPKRRASLRCASPLRRTDTSSYAPPVIASKKPYKVELVGGKRYSWCTCGHSKKQPFCDGSHKTKAPGLGPHRFVPEKDSTVWLCGCKYTNNPPFCDGTHKSEFIQCSALAEESDVKS